MKKLMAYLLLMGSVLTGCSTVAELYGYNTQVLNEQAAKNYLIVQQEAKQKSTIDTTSPTARRIQAVFQRMKPFADQANQTGVPFQWEMTVIRSNEVNAWAMPGGKMAFYTGMVNKLNLTDDEIAAVVGHEMTHALEEHAKKQYGQEILTNLAMKQGTKLLKSKANIDAGKIDKVAEILSEYGIGKPFSRSQESEADAGGLRLMAQAGYNPEAALSLWTKMNAINNNNDIVSAITSTHPTNNNRLEAMRKLLPEVMPIYEAAPKPKATQSKSNKGRRKK